MCMACMHRYVVVKLRATSEEILMDPNELAGARCVGVSVGVGVGMSTSMGMSVNKRHAS